MTYCQISRACSCQSCFSVNLISMKSLLPPPTIWLQHVSDIQPLPLQSSTDPLTSVPRKRTLLQLRLCAMMTIFRHVMLFCHTHIYYLLVISPKMAYKTVKYLSAFVRPSVRYQHFQNPTVPRPLGRRRWNLACVFYGSCDKTTRKQNIELWPLRRAGPPRT